jgi:TonB family protein
VHSSTILRRTPAGEAELAAPAQGLSLTQRRFLTLLDTSCDFGQMRLRHTGDPEKFARDLARLAQIGLVACETPAMPETADPVTESVRLGAPRFARGLPFALLPIVVGVIAWLAWQQRAPPPAAKAGDSVTSRSPAAAIRAPTADTPEPAPIATRTLRGDPAERPRAPKEAQAARVASRNTEAKAPAAEPAGNQTQLVPASDHAGNDDKAAAIAIHHGEATIAETHVVQDAAPAKTPDSPKTLLPVGATPPGAPASPNPAAATAPAVAGPNAPAATGQSKTPAEPRSADSLPIHIASAAAAAGLLRAAPTPRLVPIARDAPDFPREAIALGLATGNVKARLTVDAQGNVSSVDIVEASHRAFDRPVREALAHWRFEPGSAGRTTTVDIAFRRE